MHNPPATLKLTVKDEDGDPSVTHIYKRKNTRSGVEYRFKESVAAAEAVAPSEL